MPEPRLNPVSQAQYQQNKYYLKKYKAEKKQLEDEVREGAELPREVREGKLNQISKLSKYISEVNLN